MSLNWIAILTVLVFVHCPVISAAEGKPENVWPNAAPQETDNIGEEKATPSKPGQKQVLRISNVSTPTLQFYPAPKDKNSGTTIVVCPGGGYNILAFDLEGTEVCEWLNTIGVIAVACCGLITCSDHHQPTSVYKIVSPPYNYRRGKPTSSKLKRKRNFIRKMMKHAWNGYSKRAWVKVVKYFS